MGKLKSTQLFAKKRMAQKSNEQLKQKKFELALKIELMHKLETQLASNDTVEVEISQNAIADFLVVLDDPAVSTMYDYEQVDEALFVFRAKNLL